MELHATVEDLSPISKKLLITIPAPRVSERVERSLNTILKTAKIKGFRPGKASRAIVEQLHGPRARAEALDDLISSSLYEVLNDHKIAMVGTPSVQIEQYEPGAEVVYSAQLSVCPDPEVDNYAAFSVELEEPAAVTPEIIEESISNLIDGYATYEPILGRDIAETGDAISGPLWVEVLGDVSTEPAGMAGAGFKTPASNRDLEGSEPYDGVIGGNTLPEAVETQLIGCALGEERIIEADIPSDYRHATLRGKLVRYTFRLDRIQSKTAPELTDEFVQTLTIPGLPGKQYQNADELREKIRELLTNSWQIQRNQEAHSLILTELVKRHPFEVPDVMIDEDIRSYLVRNRLVDPQKVDVGKLPVDRLRAVFGKDAAGRVCASLIVDGIWRREGLEIDEEDIRAAIVNFAESSGAPMEAVEQYFSKEEARKDLLNEARREKALRFLLERTTITFRPRGTPTPLTEIPAKIEESEPAESEVVGELTENNL